MLTLMGRCATVLSLTAVLASSALAQNETPVLRVAAIVFPPTVFEENGSLTGISIEL